MSSSPQTTATAPRLTFSFLENNISDTVTPFGDDHCHEFPGNESVVFYVNVVALVIIILFGILGNCVVTFVYAIDKVKNSSSTLLLALSILDNILLISALFYDVLHSVFPYTGTGHWLWDNQAFFLIIARPFTKWAHTCSTWCVVLLTLDRYIAISRPLKSSKICTCRRARIYILILVIVAAIYNLPTVFEYRLVSKVEQCTNQTIWGREETTLMASKVYQLSYSVVLYFIMIYVIPLVSLVVLNTLLIKLIRSATSKRRVLTNKPKLVRKSSSLRQILMEDGVTRTIVCIIVRFIICATPALVFQILVLVDDPVKDTYQVFSNLLIYVNSSTNFIIFSVIGRRFRRTLFSRICQKKSSKLKRLIIAHRVNSNTSNFSGQTTSRLSMSTLDTLSIATATTCDTGLENKDKDCKKMSIVVEEVEEGRTTLTSDTNLCRRHSLPEFISEALSRITAKRKRYSLDSSDSNNANAVSLNQGADATSSTYGSNCTTSCIPSFTTLCDSLRPLNSTSDTCCKTNSIKFYLDDSVQ